MNSDFQVGDRIEHRWDVESVFSGGMGLVYVVMDHETGERLAAKTYRAERFAVDPALASRFEREAFAWIRLGAHPNIVEAKYVRVIRDKPFLFLEYVPGGSLHERLPLTDLGLVRQLAIEFCAGMIHAVNCGIVAHRDIKPANCLLGKVDLKIADFGMVKVFDDLDVAVDEPFVIRIPENKQPESKTEEQGTVDDVPPSQWRSLSLVITQTGVAAGTPSYMAPEQFDDAKRVGIQADIYSFGVMLFQMITGRLPFTARNMLEYRAFHQRMAPPKVGMDEPACRSWLAAHERECEYYRHARIELAKDGLPQALAGIVDRCLAKDPSQRYGDFGEVRKALRDAEPRHPDLTYRHEASVEGSVPRPARPLAGFELFSIASKCLELGLKGMALAALDHLIECYPWSRWAHIEKGKLLTTLPGRCDEGRALLQQAERMEEVQYGQRDVDEALSRILHDLVDHLFQVVGHADRCFVVLRETATGRLIPRVVKLRGQQPDVSHQFSRAMIGKCFDSGQPALIQNVWPDGTFSLAQRITAFRFQSVMCVPVVIGGKPFAVIQLDSQDRGRTFTEEDLKLVWGAVTTAESLIPFGIPPAWLGACLPRPVSPRADQTARGS